MSETNTRGEESNLKPIPDMTPVTAPYWEAAAKGQFLLPLCRDCGKFHHHPRAWCPHCWSTELDWAEPSGEATVVTFSVVHQPPSPGFEVPYTLAVVELVEGPTMMSNIIGIEPKLVRIGMTVTVDFEQRGHLAVPVFRPIP